MPADLDIYRSAKLLIEQHGQDALLEAALKADELLDAGDLDGRAVIPAGMATMAMAVTATLPASTLPRAVIGVTSP